MKIDELKLEISKWARREAELVRKKEGIEAEAGAAMLGAEPGASEETHDRLTRVLAELRAVGVAMKTAQSRRLEAIGAMRVAEIETLESSRIDLERARAVLSAKVERHRKAMVELLGLEVMIVPATLNPSSNLHSLELQIGGLEERAKRLQDSLPDSGTIDVENAVTVDPLIEALATFEGVIPAMEGVLEWAKSCEPVPSETFREFPRNFRLVWKVGQIDLQQSYTFVEALCGPGPIGTFSNLPVGLNIESGTFRATRPSVKPAVF